MTGVQTCALPIFQRQKRSPEEANHRKAQKEENAIEVPLPPVAEDDHDPEERQERPRRQNDQSQINVEVQGSPPPILSL